MEKKRRPTEFVVNSFASILTILKLDDLKNNSCFNDAYPCNIYFICRRPRIMIDKERFSSTENKLEMGFKVQYQQNFEDIVIECPSKGEVFELETEYPYSHFTLLSNGKKLEATTPTLFLQKFSRENYNTDFLGLEVLYVGQSY